jgi:hypothetical protein
VVCETERLAPPKVTTNTTNTRERSHNPGIPVDSSWCIVVSHSDPLLRVGQSSPEGFIHFLDRVSANGKGSITQVSESCAAPKDTTLASRLLAAPSMKYGPIATPCLNSKCSIMHQCHLTTTLEKAIGSQSPDAAVDPSVSHQTRTVPSVSVTLFHGRGARQPNLEASGTSSSASAR